MGRPSSSDRCPDPERTQEVLVELGRRSLEADGLDALFAAATDAVTTTLGVERCGLFERLPVEGGSRLRAGSGWADDVVGSTFPSVDGVAAVEAPRTVDDAATSSGAFAQILRTEHEVTSGLLVSVGAEETPLGVLTVCGGPDRSFSEAEETFLQGVATVLATAIERARVEDDIEEMYGRISDAFFSVDDEWRFTYLNEQARELIAPDGRTLVGKNVWEEFPEAIGRAFKTRYERAMTEQETVAFEEYYPDPLDTWFEVRAYPSPSGLSVYFRDVTERKRLEEQLRTEKEHFQVALENSPVTAFRLDTDLRYTWIGNTHEDFDAESVLGKRDDDLLPPGPAEKVMAPKRRVLETGEGVREEVTYELPSGLVSYDLTVEPLRDETGEVVGLTAAAVDLTERKEAVEALQSSEERLRLALEAADLGCWELDLRSETSTVRSPQHDRIFGYDDPVEHWSFERFLKHVHEDDRASVEESFESAYESGEWSFECRIVRADDEQRWIAAYGEFFYEGDEPARAVGVVQDVTERKERERELERSEQRYRTLARNFPNGLVTLFDEDLRYTLAAGQGFEQFDVSREEVEGKTMREAWGDEVADVVEPVLEAAIEGETTSVELSWADREWVVRGVPITDTRDDVFAGMTLAQDITERKEYERALEESERRYRTLIDHFPNGVVALFDEDYRYLAAGGELFDEVETTPDEPVGTTIYDRYPEEVIDEVEPHFAAAIDGAASSFEIERGGRYLKVQTHPVPDEEGTVHSGMLVVQDISERVESQRSLEESELRYRTLAEHFPDGLVALFDEEFRYTAAGGELLDKVETLSEDPIGETIYDRYSEAHVEEIEPYFEAALAGESSSFEAEREGRQLRAYTLPVRDEDGAIHAGMLLVQDISERKAYQQQLQERANQQEVVAELGQRALAADDIDQLMHEVTEAVSETLDTDYSKVLELLPGGDSLLLRQGVGWQDGLAGEATVPTEADSQAGYTLASSQPVVVEDLETEPRFSGPDLLLEHDVASGISVVIGTLDEPWGVLGTHARERREFTADDVTFVRSVANLLAAAVERHAYEAELETTIEQLTESNQRLEQFAYAASHDLQEPLRMVSSYLQLIEQRYGDEFDEDGQEFFAFAIDGAERMRDMINALLKYSRVETEGEAFEPVDLEVVVDDVRDDLKLRIEETDATVEVEPLPTAEADGRQLRQVFQNLLHNALEYSGDAPPQVTVSAARHGQWLTVSVRDEGIGIEEEHTERIFEVFQRLHGPDEHDGTGIGLALCERIVERHGGEIWVESTPGEGATFSFTLPAARRYDG